MDSAEGELESFRRQWRQEVSERTKGRSGPAQAAQLSGAIKRSSKGSTAAPQAKNDVRDQNEGADDFEGRTFHDLEDKEELLKLGNEAQRAKAVEGKEPKTALEHYEKAVERETQGILQDSVNLYRKAFKLDSHVHEAYKAKHFPPSSFPPKLANTSPGIPTVVNTNPSGTPSALPNPAHHSLDGFQPSITELIAQFSHLSIPAEPPATDFSPPPPCPIISIPEELLSEIFMHAAIDDVNTLSHLSLVCKRFAFLAMTEDRVWKKVALGPEFGMAAMHYRYTCDLKGLAIDTTTAPTIPDLTPGVWPTYRAQFRRRPRVRFNGCYISTVNYTRPGASHQSMSNWSSPVLIVTYFRYLRFFRNGTCISLLTTSEPQDVVHHLTWENCHKHHAGGLPSVVMKDGLKGRWRLSGPAQVPTTGGQINIKTDVPETNSVPTTSSDFWPLAMDNDEIIESEEEGDVHIETDGVTPKYMWRMQFALGNAGRKDGSRNTKLSWKGFWSYNKLTDDWGEFGLKNDKAFFFSRVKSYGMGL